jgi:hypothetical protein
MPTFSLLHYAITFHRIQHMESRPQGAGIGSPQERDWSG